MGILCRQTKNSSLPFKGQVIISTLTVSAIEKNINQSCAEYSVGISKYLRQIFLKIQAEVTCALTKRQHFSA